MAEAFRDVPFDLLRQADVGLRSYYLGNSLSQLDPGNPNSMVDLAQAGLPDQVLERDWGESL